MIPKVRHTCRCYESDVTTVGLVLLGCIATNSGRWSVSIGAARYYKGKAIAERVSYSSAAQVVSYSSAA
jgi:hypothetical protein